MYKLFTVHHGTLEKEEEFIEQCMESLMTASAKTQEVLKSVKNVMFFKHIIYKIKIICL